MSFLTYDDFVHVWTQRENRRKSGPRCYSRFTYAEMGIRGADCYVVYREGGEQYARFNIRFAHHRIVLMVGWNTVRLVRATDEALVEARLRGIL